MNLYTTVVPARGFQNKALSVIFGEVKRMTEVNEKYIGVAFTKWRDAIDILYAWDHGTFNGQPQQYPRSLWADVCFAMYLIGRIAHRKGWPELVRLSDAVGSGSSQWSIYPTAIGENPLSTLRAMLQKVDAVIKNLDAPLDMPGAN